MQKCPCCNEPMEIAEYLEGEEGFGSDYICMNEDCKTNKSYYILKESDNKFGLYEAKENNMFNSSPYQWKFFRTPAAAEKWARENSLIIKK